MPTQNHRIYSLDANALIAAWIEIYRPESFESFWEKLDTLMANGRAKVSEEVHEELKRKDDGLHEWLAARPHAIVGDTDKVQNNVRKILTSHPLLVKARKNRSGADPFVIAVAMCDSATVVSQEPWGSESTPKIPDVCKAYSVPLLRISDLITAEGWRF